MTKSADEDVIIGIVRRTRLEQGLPPKISGAATTAKLATLVASSERRPR